MFVFRSEEILTLKLSFNLLLKNLIMEPDKGKRVFIFIFLPYFVYLIVLLVGLTALLLVSCTFCLIG